MSGRRKFEIITSNDTVVVVNKHPGVLSIRGRNPREISVQEMLARDYDPLYTVHRIDRDTSGVLVFARTSAAHKKLCALFERRAVTKSYLALCAGSYAETEFSINGPLRLSSSGKVHVHRAGKPSFTHFRILERYRGYLLVEAIPETGRQHQIRVHLQHLGIPLIVDPLYHSERPLTILDIKPGASPSKNNPAFPLLQRTPLHASTISFALSDGEVVKYSAPLPKDMRATVNQLKKWRKSGQ